MEEHSPRCNKPAQEENIVPAGARNIFGGVDSISSLPDEILHHILSFVPTNLAITTSVLSKRWKHVWCNTPYLSFPRFKASIESISKTLASYSADKIMSFHFYFDNVESKPYETSKRSPHVDSLIKFAISHKVEKLSLVLNTFYNFPDFFFSNSSLKQLILDSYYSKMIPRCTVSWTSLRNLSLMRTVLSDESFPKILSGSPMLESLTLHYFGSLCCLDLSESICLRRLDIEFSSGAPHRLHIMAPHIHYLRLIDFRSECTLADVPSLLEANIDTTYYLPRLWCVDLDDPSKDLDDPSNDLDDPSKDEYQVKLQAMLEKLQNGENLTVGLSFLQMLTIAEFRGVSFPTFKFKTLTLKTTILRSAGPGIAKLLRHSPGLKKINFHKTEDWNCAVEKYVNRCLDPQDPQDLIFPAKSAFKVAEQDLVASFMELLLRNTRSLETLVVQLGSCLNSSNFDEMSQIALTLSHKSKVSIVLK